MTHKYFGIGKNSVMNINKKSFALFSGFKMLSIAYHTPKYGYGLRFYFYDNLEGMQQNDLLSLYGLLVLFFSINHNVDAMKSSGFKGTNLSNEMNLINSTNLTQTTKTAIFYSMC